MKSAKFWSLYFPGTLILVGVIYFFFSAFNPFTPGYDFVSVLETFDIPIKQIYHPLKHFTTETEGLIIWKKALANPQSFSNSASFIHWGLVISALVLLHGALLRAGTLPGLIGLGIIYFWIGTLPLGEFKIPYSEQKIQLILYAGLSLPLYLISGLKKWIIKKTFVGLLILSSIHIGLLLFLFNLEGQELAHFKLIQFSYPAWIISTIVLILLVAHEPIHAMARVLASGGAIRKNGMMHFLFISLLFLGNLILDYLAGTGELRLDLLTITPLLILLLSIILGFFHFPYLAERWGFWKGKTGPAFFFAGLVLFAAASISWGYQDKNDAVIDVYEDIIRYSQMGLGLFFAIYMGVNFSGPASKGIDFRKVLYQGRTIPFYLIWVGGLSVVILLFLRSGKFPLFQSQGAYFAAMADVYRAEGKNDLALALYERSAGFAYRNHKALYALGHLAKDKGQRQKAVVYFKQASKGKARPEDFLATSEILAESDAHFDALFELQNGVKLFPNDPGLVSNLGQKFQALNIQDSAAYYLSRISDNDLTNSLAQSLKSRVKSGKEVKGELSMSAASNAWGMTLAGIQPEPEISILDSGSSLDLFAKTYNQSLFGGRKYGAVLPKNEMNRFSNYPARHNQLKLVRAMTFMWAGYLDSATVNFIELGSTPSVQDGFFRNKTRDFLMGIGAFPWASLSFSPEYRVFDSANAEKWVVSLIEGGRFEEAKSYVDSWPSDYTKPEWIAHWLEGSLTSENDQQIYFKTLKYLDENHEEKALLEIDKIQDKQIQYQALSKYLSLAFNPLEIETLENRYGLELKLPYALALLRINKSLSGEYYESDAQGEMISKLLESLDDYKNGDFEKALVSTNFLLQSRPWEDALIAWKGRLLLAMDKDEEAYYYLLDQIQNYSRQPALVQCFVIAAIRMGQDSSAEHELDWLKQKIPTTDYQAFEAKVQREHEIMQGWN